MHLPRAIPTPQAHRQLVPYWGSYRVFGVGEGLVVLMLVARLAEWLVWPTRTVVPLGTFENTRGTSREVTS
jgi:hypothetical protein